MFNVKVKTLDGQNHDFSVLNDINVLQFKNIIFEKLEIPVDRQRLLFQGRVLQDENLLSSYNVAGNVMHLVTRPPNQNRPTVQPTIEREENSDINRDQIRNILSDVFGNIAELSNPLGVSVNNEGNRFDITVNVPGTNRLSLVRLRQNYIHRLLNQGTELLNNLIDSNNPSPRPDRERLYQANAYDLGPNEERIVEVTAQPLPIHNLADMIHNARNLWREAEPQLELWENVLRRQNLPESIASSGVEMQRRHDSTSRFIHLFSHILHIMSDYLVEFQHGPHSRIIVPSSVNETVTPTNEAATNTSTDDNTVPLIGCCGESSSIQPEMNINSSTTTTVSDNDRSRYLYVFSEMPAQLLQVRLDVDSTIQVPSHSPSTATNTGTVPNSSGQSSRMSNESSVHPDNVNITTTSNTTNTTNTFPQATTNGNRYRIPTENFLRSTFQDSFGSAAQLPRMTGSGIRPIRTASQLIETIDPYVRCQSRHFQNPHNIRPGAVISTFGGIRFREPSRPRPRPNAGTDSPVTNATSTTSTGTTSEPEMRDSFRPFSGLINSVFPISGDTIPSAPRNTNVPIVPLRADNSDNVIFNSTVMEANSTSTTNNHQTNDVGRFLQAISANGMIRLDIPLGQLFPEIFTVNDPLESNIFNQIIQLIVNQLTMVDFMQLFNGIYNSLNGMRLPLQNLFERHQRLCEGSRDRLVDHVVTDLEFFNRGYMSVFDRLRTSGVIAGLTENARQAFNFNIDIRRTITSFNRHHVRIIVDMIFRSPTDIGFGQLLMNSVISHHHESLVLLDIICGENEELRQYLMSRFIEMLMVTIGDLPYNISQFINGNDLTLGFEWIFSSISSRLFRLPDRLTDLRQTVQTFIVPISDTEETELSTGARTCDINMENVELIDDIKSIDDVVNLLTGNIGNVRAVTEEQLENCLLPDVSKGFPASTTILSPETTTVKHTITTTDNNEEEEDSLQPVLPREWLDIVKRDSANFSTAAVSTSIPFSDAYVSGMPTKRRKIIINERRRNVQPPSEMLYNCIDQSIRETGIVQSHSTRFAPFSSGLINSFRELVSHHIGNRIVEESFNFPSEQFPSTKKYYSTNKCPQDENKNK